MPFISSIRGSFGAQSKDRRGPKYVTVSPSVDGFANWRLNDQSLIISTAGEYKITLYESSTFRARVFGAGGGGAQQGGWSQGYVGGSGGYATGIVTLPAGTHTVIVGQGGFGNAFRATIGGGGSAQPKDGTTDNRYSACGGGFSGILSGSGTVHDGTGGGGNTTYRTSGVQARSVIIAGGGGGGGTRTGSDVSHIGGHGGGSSGTGGYYMGNLDNSSFGSQSSAGSLRPNQWGQNRAGEYMLGGHGGDQGYGGGGGGGYFGGSTSDSNTSGSMGGGGGGSGYVHPTLVSSGSLIAGSGQTSPGGVSQSGYITGKSYGGNTSSNTNNSWSGGPGGDGIVIIQPV